MRPTEKIRKMFKNSNVTADSRLDKKITADMLRAFEKTESQKTGHQPNLWRIFMKSKITKLATAAMILLAVFFGINLLDKAVTPAWAIEQTIDLLKNFNGIHFSGATLDEQGKQELVEGWARANDQQTASDMFRLEADTGQIIVVSKTTQYKYDPQTNIVNIVEGQGPAMSPWIGAGFFESLKKITLDWNETLGKDPSTDRDRVFVTCSHPAAGNDGPRSWWFEFDVESKLLVSMKQWDNMARQGIPDFYVKAITYYEDLPDDLFHFEIPEGAEIVTGLPERMKTLQEPNSGMTIDNMSEEQACKEIAGRYWQAVIDGDWQTVALLRPIATADVWKRKYSGNSFEEIVSIGEPYQEAGCKLGKIVPCTIRFDDDVTKTINMIVLSREINGQRSYVIAGTWGSE